jgi:hypothetical protein
MPSPIKKRRGLKAPAAPKVNIGALLDAAAEANPHMLAFEIYATFEDAPPVLAYTVSPKDKLILTHAQRSIEGQAATLAAVCRFTGKPPDQVCAADVTAWRDFMASQAAGASDAEQAGQQQASQNSAVGIPDGSEPEVVH